MTTFSKSELQATLNRMKEYGGYTPEDTPIVLPEWLYDRAEREGVSLRGYVRRERIPRM